MSRSRWLLVVGGLLLIGVALCRWRVAASGQSADVKSSEDPVSLITRYSLEGQYDKAIQEGQLALKSDPGNPAILNQIAIVCLIRAKKEPTQLEEWVRKGSEYAQEAASGTSVKGLITIGYVVEAGRTLELAGDLSANKCAYYRRAIDVLENRGPAVTGDSPTVNGKVASLAPVLDQKAKTIGEIQIKLKNARCVQ